MADSTAHLRRKIGSAADLQSVVRAMKAQAAASVGQYAKSVTVLGDYVRNIELGLGVCFRQIPPTVATRSGPTSRDRPARAVVFGSDQGLVGRFNDKIAEYAGQTLADRPDLQVWTVGERVRVSLADAGILSQHTFAVPTAVQAIIGLVREILVTVVDTLPVAPGPLAPSELHLIYNRPATGSAYAPVAQRLLPLDDAWCRDLARRPWPTPLPAELVGDPAGTMRQLISEFVYVSIFRASAESLASENASRLAAMDRADRNIDAMLRALHDRFHRLRQSKIDEELFDVISGFKASSRQLDDGE